VEVNLSGTAADFRQQLFSLTNVAPENQKGVSSVISTPFMTFHPPMLSIASCLCLKCLLDCFVRAFPRLLTFLAVFLVFFLLLLVLLFLFVAFRVTFLLFSDGQRRYVERR